MKHKQQLDEARIWKFIGIVALVIFVGSILWSMWVDTLRPLILAGDTRAVIFNIIGLPLILVGVALFAYGGYVFVKDTFRSFQDETMLQNMAIIRSQSTRQAIRAARLETLRIFWRVWKPGLARMGLGFLILMLGSFLINR
jgi:hypothetical protein